MIDINVISAVLFFQTVNYLLVITVISIFIKEMCWKGKKMLELKERQIKIIKILKLEKNYVRK